MALHSQSSGVPPFEQAYEAVLRYCQDQKPAGKETVSLDQSLGRVLAEPLIADRDFPPFPRATRDGYAVRAADVKTGASLRVVGQVKAGSGYSGEVRAGQAVEIMTGAPVPAGADAVVMVEYTSRRNDQVEIGRSCAAGENIVPAGAEAQSGRQMLPVGARLGFAQIAAAASTGNVQLQVFRKPRVAILSTGDEIVEASRQPGPHQIRNSNSHSLAAQVVAAGGEPEQLPIAPDHQPDLERLIRQARTASLLLLSGGVSMGKFDLVEQALDALGARYFFTGALIQPGKPVVFGEARIAENHPTPFFGLPGNPVSTMVTFDLFVRPVLQALSGAPPDRLPSVKARLAHEARFKSGLTRFLPAVLRGGWQDPEVALAPWQGSGDFLAAARANCYLVVPPDQELMAAGEMVSILLRFCPF